MNNVIKVKLSEIDNFKDHPFSVRNDDSIKDIVKVIETHRENAYRKVNEKLVTMYYEIGKYLSEKVASEKWGSKVIDNIAHEINNKYPTLKGFDRRGLYRMTQFYDTYKDNEIVSTLLSQISWSNNIAILSVIIPDFLSQ